MNNTKKTGIIIALLLISLVVFSSALPVNSAVMEEEGFYSDGGPDEDDTPFDLYSLLKKYFGRPGLNETKLANVTEEYEYEEILEPALSDDEIFLQILGRDAFSFNVLALQCMIALDQSDAGVLVRNADQLSTLSIELHDEVAGLMVEPSNLGRKQEFLSSMSAFTDIASRLQKGVPSSAIDRRDSYNSLTQAIERLENAIRNVNCEYNPLREEDSPPLEIGTVLIASTETVTKPDGILGCTMPFIYKDAKQSNEISIYPRYARIVRSLYYDSTSGTQYLNAPAGRSYLLVFIQITHRGNLDGKTYTISTPAPSAFTLHGPDGTYKPVSTTKFTSAGEMYTQTTLNRKENSQSFLLFEVPATLTPDAAYLSVSLGSEYGTVNWDIA